MSVADIEPDPTLPPCSPLLIIGVRGSGEGYTGPYGMGERVTPYVAAALNGMPASYVRTHSLTYPATPVSNLLLWQLSAVAGMYQLVADIESTAERCPGIRIGLVGYSQGAYVINMALNRLTYNVYHSPIYAVLLLSDPASAQAKGDWRDPHEKKLLVNEGGVKELFPNMVRSHGMLGGRDIYLPADRITDLCIQGDPVCDSKNSSVIWNSVKAAFNTRIHTQVYQVCCGDRNNLRVGLGGEFRERMMWPPFAVLVPPPTPPTGSPFVSSVNGLPDGTVLVTSDSKRIYKMVGGAPIWLTSCANGLCPNPRPTDQTVINAGPAVPRDSATAQDEAGNVFKFVGGAPIHLSSCSVGCGNPVPITAGSIVNYDHMRHTPADGATAKDEAGNVFKFVGGAPIHLSNCSVGCGNPVPITGWSVATLEHMLPYPADGVTAKDEAGNIFKFAGGAPIHLASCAVDCGDPVPITGWSVATLEHMKPVPDDGTTIVTETGAAHVFAGGAPLRLSSCEIGCETAIHISGASIANLDHMRPFPADNTTVRTESGAIYKFAGGAPLHLTTCDPGCGDWVDVTQWTVDTREHMRPAPADGTNIKAVESGTLFRARGGEADLAGQCPSATGCTTAVAVNQASVDPIAHGVANRGPGYGLLVSYSNGAETRSSLGSVPAGYRLAATFGLLARTAGEGTLPFYSCQTGGDVFSSTSTTCEGRTVLSRLGYIYAAPPAGHPAVAVFRCKTKEGGEHFDSADPNCNDEEVEGRLGYVLGYGRLTRFNAGGEHGSATTTVPAGYQPEGTLGLLPLATTPGTIPVFTCRLGTELFTSTSTTCEGQTKVSQLGFIYTAPPADQPSVPVYRCKTAAGDHFDSLDAGCENRVYEGQLGYVLARKVLTRAVRGTDHRTGTGVFPPGYRHEGTLGILASTTEAGTKPLYSCQSGGDAFTSLAADCEGKEKLGQLGGIWGQPPAGVPSLPLYRCKDADSGEHFDATTEACGGNPSEGLLGYLRVDL